MIRLLVRFLLSLCIILLSGYSHIHAHNNENAESYSTATKTASTSLGSCRNNQVLHIKPLSSGSKKENNKIDDSAIETEEKDDDLHSFKKFIGQVHFFISIFHFQVSELFFSDLNKSLHFGEHFSSPSSYRLNLIFQVFRI